jgi:hypothetical protein
MLTKKLKNSLKNVENKWGGVEYSRIILIQEEIIK